jgi:hypothetical protein
MNIGAPVNTAYYDQSPSISAYGLSLYFSSDRPGGYGIDDLWVTTRASVSDSWGPPVNLGATVNTSADEWMPSIAADGLVLFFMSSRAGGFGGNDLWFTNRATKNDPWGSPVNLGAPINSSFNEALPDISADGLRLFFSDHMLGPWRPGGHGGQDLWVTKRATTNDSWGEPVNLGPVINGSDHDLSPNISADGSTVYFCSNRPGGIGSIDLWQAPIIPIVDFNGDGIVDVSDLVILIEHWGQASPQCDIGPMPWGDGKVDAKDLEALMRYWGQEVDDPTLVGFWPFDETEGLVANDRTGGNRGSIMGSPQWRPTGGRIGGALELDGATSIVANSPLNPADGPFSVLTWIRGGAPGQVIISQMSGVQWLMAEAGTGALMTELSRTGRADSGLSSEAIITDGNWHRIAFTWDGASRQLYVDGVLVAEDAHDTLAGGQNSLVLGASHRLTHGTFWSGLIDDLRIYNRAVKP